MFIRKIIRPVEILGYTKFNLVVFDWEETMLNLTIYFFSMKGYKRKCCSNNLYEFPICAHSFRTEAVRWSDNCGAVLLDHFRTIWRNICGKSFPLYEGGLYHFKNEFEQTWDMVSGIKVQRSTKFREVRCIPGAGTVK